MATEHLLQSGCKCVAYVGGGHVSTARNRAGGYRSPITAAGLPMLHEHTVNSVSYDDAQTRPVMGRKKAPRIIQQAQPDFAALTRLRWEL
jgi:DNA-binding LacI/PurR family transcriptional regulator